MIKNLLNKFRTLLTIMLVVVSVAAWSQPGTFKNGVKQGQIKVKFTPEMSTQLTTTTVNARSSGFTTGIQSVDAAAKTTRASNMYRLFPFDPKFEHKLRKHGLHLWYVVEISEETDPKTAVSQFKKLREISTAEVEHEKVLAPTEVKPYVPTATASASAVLPFNDPLLKDQWHYNNSGQVGVGDADINLFEAWQTTTGANNIIVAVHDQGVDVKHVDLKANIWVNHDEIPGNGIDDDNNGYKDDINGYNFQKNIGAVDAENHGTHVAGTIAAVNNNGIGVGGVAGGNGTGNGVKIMSLQILGGAPIEKSYVYAANNGAVISQNSWGYTSPGFFDQSVADAIDYFIAEAGDYQGSPMRGGIVIFAAGNSDSDNDWYPGFYESTFAVASIGPEWKKAYYSNYGDWVEVSAPGGDLGYGNSGGVLSTLPKDLYGYFQGTSMACPHMSGVAALALANRDHQLVPAELWNKLITGAVNIDEHNEDYVGELGSGAIDAALAIKNSQGVAPLPITNLTATDVSQEIAKLTWTVPADLDDSGPIAFTIHYSKQLITESNLATTSKITVENDSLPGKTFNYEVTNLLGLTHYYFAVVSRDRWGIASPISNIIEVTTNDGPAIAVTPVTVGGTSQSNPSWTIDALASKTGTQNLTIQNNAAGLLRYKSFMRPRGAATSPTSLGDEIVFPVASPSNGLAHLSIVGSEDDDVKKIYNNEPITYAYTPIVKTMMSFITNLIGETDTSLPNSAAGRFDVTEAGGFNLTNVKMTMKLTRAATVTEPIILEVYSKNGLAKENRLYAQAYTSTNLTQFLHNIVLSEQLYFAQGESFYVVLHVPNGNLFPLGIGPEKSPEISTQCFYSSDVGNSWMALDEALNAKEFSWALEAHSLNADVGTYLTLAPAAGDVSGMTQTVTTITADANNLINGNYGANLVLQSNDAINPELRVPVYLKVANHQPNLKVPAIADYSTVFIGSKKSYDLVLDNQGYGRIASLTAVGSYVISGTGASQFIIETSPSKPSAIAARDQGIVRVSFVPTAAGVANATLTIIGKSGNNTTYTHTISLFGVGAETSKIDITPITQTITPVTIGDNKSATVTVQNTGAFPLKYFVPGYDTKGVSENWPSTYHKYGYKFRTNYLSDPDPITYAFQDIKSTGVDITQHLLTHTVYYTLDMGFSFPYYDKAFSTIYIAQKGFTVFDNSIRPINSPEMNPNAAQYRPSGYISLLGTFLSFVKQGNVYYQKEADRLIIQFDNVTDGTNPQTITAQMVLFSNGDIRFYYKTMGFTVTNQRYLNILIEDFDKKDGILVHDFSKTMSIPNSTAFGFDYPGPNIITGITNGSGILAPGAQATVTVNLKTDILAEGVTKRAVNFISNDPANAQKNAIINLDVTAGGTATPVYSTDEIAFGDVFQGANRSLSFTIKNTGTANVNITGMAFNGGSFTLNGDAAPLSVNPGLYKTFDVVIPTATIANLVDDLVITYADASTHIIHVTGNVVAAPAITADLTAVNQALNYKETASVPFNIDNTTGNAALEVSISAGKHWVTYEATGSTPASVTYEFYKENTGAVYQWLDIRSTGTHLNFPVDEIFTKEGFWETITLPYPIEFYGTSYNQLKVGINGVVSFEADPEVMFFSDNVPSQSFPGAHIMPYWSFTGGFDAIYNKPEDVGVFYQASDDKIIITWSHMVNNFGGMGEPMSAQLYLYKNGAMKFQYRVEKDPEGGGDQTSNSTLIGLQKNSSEGILISPKVALDYGTSTGLAYILVPVKKHVVAAGATLNGNINFNSHNVYGGIYDAQLQIKSNTPNQELLQKPVQLTVNALAVYEGPASADFGSVLVPFPLGYSKPIEIKNTGSAPLDITKLALTTSRFGVNAYAYTYNYLPSPSDPVGWAWRTTSLTFCATGITPPHSSGCNITKLTILPSEKQVLNILYFPPSLVGTHTDNLAITSNAGINNVALSGNTFRAPGLNIVATGFNESVNTLDIILNRKIPFSTTNTNNGQTSLNYTVGIEYGRVATTSAEATATAATPATKMVLETQAAKNSTSVMAVEDYNRVIRHTTDATPATWVGVGGATPFTYATKYNAGPTGFSLSHVETFFRPESVSSGKITVEIRAGGTSPSTAHPVTQGSYNFTSSGEDEAGSWITIPMDHVGGIYPNEDFYVIITAPMGIAYPQGTITDATVTSGRYFFYDFDLSVWYDLNTLNGFKQVGWLMLAAEKTAGVTSWLNVTSSLSGSNAPGVNDTIRFAIDSHYALRGNQIANIVFTTNDPAKKVTKIPVSLHVNEAPRFDNLPEKIMMAEGETLSVTIPVTDLEGNSFTVVAAQTYPGMTHSYNEGVLTLTLTPDFGHEGSYVYEFTATDEYGAERTISIPAEVIHTNRAPKFIGSDVMSFYANGLLTEYAINSFFADPDNDTFTYSLASSNTASVLVFATSNSFLIKPVAVGTSRLNFVVTDSYGAITNASINVTVSMIPVDPNQAPKFIGDKEMHFNATGQMIEHAIADFWSDPDGDSFTYTLTSTNTASVMVFASAGTFLIKPVEVGVSKLAFNVTDSHGAITKDTITVNVDVVLSADEGLPNNGFKAYPNPATDFTTVHLSNDWTGEVDLTVIDISGKQYLNQSLNTATSHEINIDVSKLKKGIYVIRAVSPQKQATIKILKK